MVGWGAGKCRHQENYLVWEIVPTTFAALVEIVAAKF
jgi:hypothetical protein